MGIKCHQTNSSVVCKVYVNYEEAGVFVANNETYNCVRCAEAAAGANHVEIH